MADVIKDIPKQTEGILEIEVNQNSFFIKKGSIDNTAPCSHPFSFPIIYSENSEWLPKYKELQNDIIELLSDSDKQTVNEWIDLYLSDEFSNLPEIIVHRLKKIRHSILPLYAGDIEPIKSLLEVIEVNGIDTKLLWAKRIKEALYILTNYLPLAPEEYEDILFKVIQSLKKTQRNLPPLPISENEKFALKTTAPIKKESTAYVGTENIIESFQNRDNEVDSIRNFFANKENKVLFITGSIGVGKSDFINWMFRKHFSDWQPIRVTIAKDSQFSRLLAEMGYMLGIQMDMDILASASKKVVNQKIKQILNYLYTYPKRALILDDLYNIFRKKSLRDYTQFSTFVELAANPENYTGGRIFLISSQWIPQKWLYTKGVSHLKMKSLEDLYIRGIIEFHLRRLGLVRDETIPELPQNLLDVIKGHPLSAKLVVESLRKKDLNQLSNELVINEITSQVAKALLLLERAEIDEDEKLVMKMISYFRLPVILDKLLSIDEFSKYKKEIMELSNRCILNYDGNVIEMHEAIRKYYQYEVIPKISIDSCHKLAAEYYKKIYKKQRTSLEKDPGIIAELVHHLILSNQLDELKDYRLLVSEAIKPAARILYRERRDYRKALSFYRLIAEILPDDPEVFAYIGRCHARFGQWRESDIAFEKAIDIAWKTHTPNWWIYRDWGHIRARFGFHEEAYQHFEKASVERPDDPSIKGTLAYMYWMHGNFDKAYKLFEEALEINQYHEYCLTYFSKFLKEIGQEEYANSLKKRSEELEFDSIREPTEYDLDDLDD